MLGASLHLLSGAARAQCSKDIECKGDRVCTAGVCAEPNVAPQNQSAGTTRSAAPSTVEPTAVPQAYRRRNRGLMVTGIVLTSVGAASLLAATVLAVLERNCNSDLRAKYPNNVLPASGVAERDRCNSYGSPFVVFALSGVVFTATGLPMWLVGAKKVPSTPSASLAPWLTPSSGGLTLQLRL